MKHLDPTAVHEQPLVVVYPFVGEQLGNSWGTVGRDAAIRFILVRKPGGKL